MSGARSSFVLRTASAGSTCCSAIEYADYMYVVVLMLYDPPAGFCKKVVCSRASWMRAKGG